MEPQVINITPRSNRERRDHYESNKPVSYTHLTLPTILRV